MFQSSNLSDTLKKAYRTKREQGLVPPHALRAAKQQIAQSVARRMCPSPFYVPSVRRGEQTYVIEYNDFRIDVRWDYVNQEYAFEGVGEIETMYRPHGVHRGGEEILLGTSRGWSGNKSVLVLEYTWGHYFKDTRKTLGAAYAQRAADEYIARISKWAEEVAGGQCSDREWRIECDALNFWEYSPSFTWEEEDEVEAWVEDQLRYLVSKINHISS